MAKLVIANWKQNKNLEEVKGWLDHFASLIKDVELAVNVVIAPSYPYLEEVSRFTFGHPNIFTAAQDVSESQEGAFTGKVGVLQLKDFCDYCIVGHSETHDTRELVHKKTHLLLQNGIKPIVCFVSYDDGIMSYHPDAILAYEDPANISKDGVYEPKEISDVVTATDYIKSQVKGDTTLVYGGSVNRQNAASLGNISQLDGVLVGNASLDPQHFFEIVQNFNN